MTNSADAAGATTTPAETLTFTDDEAAAKLFGLFDRIASLHATLEQTPPPTLRVWPGSLLDADNRDTAPHHLSHGAAAAIGSAAEHMHGVRALIAVAGRQLDHDLLVRAPEAVDQVLTVARRCRSLGHARRDLAHVGQGLPGRRESSAWLQACAGGGTGPPVAGLDHGG